MRIYTTDVIPTSIVSDHDAPFACTNVRVNRYQQRYKYIRNMKTFDEQEFIAASEHCILIRWSGGTIRIL